MVWLLNFFITLTLVRRDEQDGEGNSKPGPGLPEGPRKFLGSAWSRSGASKGKSEFTESFAKLSMDHVKLWWQSVPLDYPELGQSGPWTICSLDNPFLGKSVPWKIRSLCNLDLGQSILNNFIQLNKLFISEYVCLCTTGKSVNKLIANKFLVNKLNLEKIGTNNLNKIKYSTLELVLLTY